MTNGKSELEPHRAAQQLRGLDPLGKGPPKQVQRAINREAAWGLTGGAHAQAAGFIAEARVDATEMVAERAMLGLDRLHRIEAAMAKTDPVKAEQYAGLVDDFLLVARTELRRLPREF
jgi:hypothetical protein